MAACMRVAELLAQRGVGHAVGERRDTLRSGDGAAVTTAQMAGLGTERRTADLQIASQDLRIRGRSGGPARWEGSDVVRLVNGMRGRYHPERKKGQGCLRSMRGTAAGGSC